MTDKEIDAKLKDDMAVEAKIKAYAAALEVYRAAASGDAGAYEHAVNAAAAARNDASRYLSGFAAARAADRAIAEALSVETIAGISALLVSGV